MTSETLCPPKWVSSSHGGPYETSLGRGAAVTNRATLADGVTNADASDPVRC